MYTLIEKNKRNTIIMLVGFVVFIGLIGIVFGYLFEDWGVTIGVTVAGLLYALIQYLIADKTAVSMAKAQEITKKDNPRLYNIVENLALTAGIPMPKVYISPETAPNAFASGRNPENSLVCATAGLLDIMDDEELRAVMAHELSHIRNYDIRVNLIVFGLVSAIGVLADLGYRMLFYGNRRDNGERSPVGLVLVLVTTILAPFFATIAKFGVSREREYLADASAVELTRYPEGMINALKKLAAHTQPMKNQNPATEAMYINNPLRKGAISNLFSTHPSLEKRIERLEHGKTKF